MEEYAGAQFVGIDLHRRRSVIVRMTEAGQVLETTRIVNDADRLAAVLRRAGESPEVVLEATYGLAVNGGPLGDLVGIPEAIPVPILLPVGIFAILFGLSMDYEVFLLSRIKKEYDRTGDNSLSVADGLAKSARVITAGAAVMVTVFFSFVLGADVLGKMFGIGLGAAILIDATIVRMVLVPATMELLGDRNWWLPGWLDRLLPNIHAEGHEITDDQVDVRELLISQRTSSGLRDDSHVGDPR